MLTILRAAAVLVGLSTLVLGIAVPLAFTGLASLAFPGEAAGSLVSRDGRVVGSALVGQAFAEDRYLHARPSATAARPYDATASAASQLGPSSATLQAAVLGRVAAAGGGTLPADAATGSGSGLDPHVSPANAGAQIPRIARARGVAEAEVASLVAAHAEDRPLGVLGEKRVNVLRLNLALDAMR